MFFQQIQDIQQFQLEPGKIRLFLFLPGILRLQNQYGIIIILEIQIQIFQEAAEMRTGVFTRIMEKIAEKFFRHQRAAGLDKLHIFSGFVQLDEGIFYFFRKIAVVQRLFNIVEYAQTDSPLGVFKFIIGAYQNDLYLGIDGESEFAHRDPVQIRHFNIRDDQIHRDFLHGFQGGTAVVLDDGYLGVQLIPSDILFDPLCCQSVIVNNHYFLHFPPPFD